MNRNLELDCNGAFSSSYFTCFNQITLDEVNNSQCEAKLASYPLTSSKHIVSTYHGRIVTIFSLDSHRSQCDSDTIELEFDADITAATWHGENSAAYLLIGDKHGAIHFITSEGRVLVSHIVEGITVVLCLIQTNLKHFGRYCLVSEYSSALYYY